MIVGMEMLKTLEYLGNHDVFRVNVVFESGVRFETNTLYDVLVCMHMYMYHM